MVVAEKTVWHGVEKAWIHTTTGNPMQHDGEIVYFAYDTFESASEYTEVEIETADELLAILTGEES